MSQIIHNTGVNNTLYYNVVNYWKTIMGNHPGIGAASMGDLWDFGERQFPQYPIANIQILETDFGISVSNFKCQLMVADKVKNRNNESNPTTNTQTIPYYQVDDKVDIYANTLAIINDLTSFTQRGVQGFEINDEIICTPFADRLDNGVAGWTAEFTLTTHNNKDRCLFNLINPLLNGYLIQDCITGDYYKAVLAESGSIGQVFSAPYVYPNAKNITTSYGVNCYTIINTFENSNEFDLVNLPILQTPTSNFGDCPTCLKWIAPQVWGTTFQSWNLAPDQPYKTWNKA